MPHRLVAALGSGSVGMNLGMAGVNDEPFVIGGVNEALQQPLPNTLVAPPAKTPMGVFPIAVVGRQVAPWRSGAQDSQDGVNEEAVVFGYATPNALSSRQMRFHEFPSFIAEVMASMGGRFVRLLHGFWSF